MAQLSPFFRQFALVAGALTLLWGCPRRVGHPTVNPKRVEEAVKGIGLGLFATDPAYDYAHLLDEIVLHGATDLLVVVPWYQKDLQAHAIGPRRGYSPSNETLARTLAQAQARGLRTALLPIVRLEERKSDQWRGRIAPQEGASIWFEHYAAFLFDMAAIAERTGVFRLGVGSELLSLEAHEAKWRGLIKQVRGRFSGRLFYSANWDHHAPIAFWDDLDEVGVTGYFELTDQEDFSDADLHIAWSGALQELEALGQRTQKRVIMTEVGYPSRTSAARHPWDETRKAPLDMALQARLLRVFCQAQARDQALGGFYIWNWFGFGGGNDGGYTPRGKPAAKVVQECLFGMDLRDSL